LFAQLVAFISNAAMQCSSPRTALPRQFADRISCLRLRSTLPTPSCRTIGLQKSVPLHMLQSSPRMQPARRLSLLPPRPLPEYTAFAEATCETVASHVCRCLRASASLVVCVSLGVSVCLCVSVGVSVCFCVVLCVWGCLSVSACVLVTQFVMVNLLRCI
jgi:hypothetical protein